ncbi:MAG: TIGR03619 family F420-dependent LLM class oxidoreductase [Chloroflexi bacterium]|nr:TIGR03619 family F420-dependent LLM class oxidoreductase [Chloroflexota bacterium]
MPSTLELGAQIPAWHWDYSAGELRDWAQGVEALGFDWLAMTDHVLYTYPLPERPTAGRYMGGTFQHETLTTLAYLAACTSRVVLQSAVLVLPQREPVLVAKQAAEIDLLSEGRFRLGVGLGWQEAEFAALGARFGQRPSRFEEAIGILRACWSEEPVNFAGRYTTLEGMSMVPKPATPGGPRIMVGGSSTAAVVRAARIADGWIGLSNAGPERAATINEKLRAGLAAAGRDAESFLVQWSTPLVDDLEALEETLRGYRDGGAQGIGVSMPSFDAKSRISVDAYLSKLEAVSREVWPSVVS